MSRFKQGVVVIAGSVTLVFGSITSDAAFAVRGDLASGEIREHARELYRLPKHLSASFLDLSNKGATFALARRGKLPDRLMFVKRDTGTAPRQLRHTRGGWSIQSTSLSGNWAVTVEMVGADFQNAKRWRIVAVNTVTNDSEVLARSRQGGHLPYVEQFQHNVYYSTFVDPTIGGSEIERVDARAPSHPKTVLKLFRGVAFSVFRNGIWLSTDKKGATDSYIARVLAGSLSRIDRISSGYGPQVFRGRMLWGSGNRLLYGTTGGSVRRSIDASASTHPVIGNNFIVDIANQFGSYGVVVRSMTTGSSKFLKEPRGHEDLLFAAAHGNNVGWFTNPGGDPLAGGFLVLERVVVSS